MEQFTIHYRFSHRFPYPAKEVYEWATDFRPDDMARMKREGSRGVERLDDHTLVLTDTVKEKGKPVTKVRVVRLFPEWLLWTNTRISDYGKYSQFIYQMVPEGARRSRLDFTGAQIDYADKKPSAAKLAQLAKKVSDEDSLTWVRLGEALSRERGPRRSPGASKS